MPLRITTIDGKRTVVCEPNPPAIGVLPPQKWRPSQHASILQMALLHGQTTDARQRTVARSAPQPRRDLPVQQDTQKRDTVGRRWRAPWLNPSHA